MKLALFSSLSALALSAAVATTAIASEVNNRDAATNRSVHQTPPVTLVNLAQQGYLRDQGIPSGQTLIQAIASGKVTPESLVQAGIESDRVTLETLNDQGYLNQIEVQFRDIVQDFSISSGDVLN
jgi:hypothetical protein